MNMLSCTNSGIISHKIEMYEKTRILVQLMNGTGTVTR